MKRKHTSRGRLELAPLIGTLLLVLGCGSVQPAAADAGGRGGGDAAAADVDAAAGGAAGGGRGGAAGGDQDGGDGQGGGGDQGGQGGVTGAGGTGGCAAAVVEGMTCNCGGTCARCPHPDSYTPCATGLYSYNCKLGGDPFLGCQRRSLPVDGGDVVAVCVASCP